jgi:hypothetical protein
MAKNYKSAYLNNPNRQDIHQIFDDLDKLRDFCREKLLPFNEADLYNRSSPVWNRYYNHTQKLLRTEGKEFNNEKREYTPRKYQK